MVVILVPTWTVAMMASLLLLAAHQSAAHQSHQAHLGILRNRTLTPLLPTSSSLPGASAAARAAASSLDASNYSWPDIDYADVSHGAHDHWQPSAHLSRLYAMAAPLVACHLPVKNPLCNDSRLESQTKGALEFWLKRNPCSENWWFNQIYVPGELSKVLLLLQHGQLLATDTLHEADVVIRRGADWWKGWSGYNLVSMAQLQIYRGLLLDDEGPVNEGFSAVWSQLSIMPWPAPTPSHSSSMRCNSSSVASVSCIAHSCIVGGGTYVGDGIQADGSFHQHGAELEDGAYGSGLTEAILDFLPVGNGLPWQISSSHLHVLAKLVLDGQQRMTLPGRVWDWQVCGRGCVVNHNRDGTGAVARNTFQPAKLRFAASLLPNGDAARLRFLAFADEQEGIRPGKLAEEALLGTYSFFRSDYLLHRRVGWQSSWKGRSNRSIPARCVNHDSKLSADTGEGATFVYRTEELGTAHAGIWPLIDWQKYPGVTVQQGALQPCAWQYEYDVSPWFVGSVSDGTIGAAAQDMAQNTGMTARRSWFFGESVASVISHENVSQPKNHTQVFTTVANQHYGSEIYIHLRKMGPKSPSITMPVGHMCAEGGTNYRAETVAALWHNHTTYLFRARSGRLHIDCSNKTGDWSRVGTNPGGARARLFRVSFEHSFASDVDPYSDKVIGLPSNFSYTVLPNTDMVPVMPSAGVARSSEHLWQPGFPREVLAQQLWVDGYAGDGTAHVLANSTAGVASVIFWSGGNNIVTLNLSVAHPRLIVLANKPCLVLLNATIDGIFVTASSPLDQPNQILKLNFPGIISRKSRTDIVRGARCSAANGALHIELPSGESSGNSTTCEIVTANHA
jgi:chondroitin AC lyase